MDALDCSNDTPAQNDDNDKDQTPEPVSSTQSEAQTSVSAADCVRRMMMQFYLDHLACYGLGSLPPLRAEDTAWLQREIDRGWQPKNLGVYRPPLRIDPEPHMPAEADSVSLPSVEVCRANARAAAVRAIKRRINESISSGCVSTPVLGEHLWVMPLSTD